MPLPGKKKGPSTVTLYIKVRKNTIPKSMHLYLRIYHPPRLIEEAALTVFSYLLTQTSPLVS